MSRFSGYKKQKTLQESFTATLYSGTSLHYDSQLMNITNNYSKQKIVISYHIHLYVLYFIYLERHNKSLLDPVLH